VLAEHQRWIDKISQQALSDSRIKGAILFGSAVHSECYRDIDIALFVSSTCNNEQCFQIRIEFLKRIPDIFDIQIFNILPVAIRHEILKGDVIFAESEAYELAYQCIKEYEDFQKYRDLYREAYLHAD